jgi:hypothetical protein
VNPYGKVNDTNALIVERYTGMWHAPTAEKQDVEIIDQFVADMFVKHKSGVAARKRMHSAAGRWRRRSKMPQLACGLATQKVDYAARRSSA